MSRSLLLRSAASAALALAVAAPVWAQDADDGDDAAAETIVVTGSRIAQSNLDSPTPVNVFNAEQIELSGAINTADLLRTLPAAGVSTLTSTNSNFLVQSSGVNTVELRNLGEDRTLVLVNGRRFVGGIQGSQNVDFNSIPTEFIERIDVVTGGASAIYGSDALAGVVNVILKDNFEGAVASVQTGLSDEGDFENHRAALTFGAPFDGGRGQALASVTWSKQGGVYARDREGQERDGFSSVFFGAPVEEWQEDVIPFYSSFSERGRIIVPGVGNYVFDETTGEVRPFTSADPDTGDAIDGFNRQAFRAIAVPTERFLFSSAADYEISPQFNLFFEGTYASTETQSDLEPFPLSSEDIYGDQLAQFIDDDGDGVADRGAFGISILNPFVPEGIREQARIGADFDGDGVQDIADEDLVVGFARRTTELINRGANNIRQTGRIVTGMRGDLNEDWAYEVSLNLGRTTQAQNSTGQVNVVNFLNALDVVEDPANPGSFICADEIARAQGCAPINIFGKGAISPEAADYVRAPSSRDAEISQAVLSGFVTGDLAFASPMASESIAVAGGGEYRSERSSSIPDALSQVGLNAGNISPVVEGDFQVGELFGEVDVPLIQDMQFAQDVRINAAARWSDYTTVGNTFAWALNGEWAMNDMVRFRGQYSEAVRAPNIGELFQPQAETFEGGADPCQGLTVDGSGTAAFLNDTQDGTSGIDTSTVGSNTANACLGDPNLAARVARDGFYVPSQAEIQGVGGFNGGNPNLSEETAETFTIGGVFSPELGNKWLDPFSISVDYYNIKINDAIQGLARQTSIDQCYVESGGVYDASSPFCANVVRYATGPFTGAIDELNALQQNLATLETAGYDIQASYNLAFNELFANTSANLGDLDISVIYGYLDKWDQEAFPGADIVEFAGTQGFSEHEMLLGFVYGRDNLTVAWDTTWIGEAVLEPDGFFADAVVPQATFHDVQVRYELPSSGIQLIGGVDNVTDEFIKYGLGIPDDPASATEGAIYDAIGRRWYVGVRATF